VAHPQGLFAFIILCVTFALLCFGYSFYLLGVACCVRLLSKLFALFSLGPYYSFRARTPLRRVVQVLRWVVSVLCWALPVLRGRKIWHSCPLVSSFGFSKTKKVPHQGKEEARSSRFRSLTISWSNVQTDTLL
jgi:hypothetical protein